MRKLTLEDIVDLRAYERERNSFRNHIIDLKNSRRLSVGNIMTLVFECTETMRFQVQEMARAERMINDERILGEIEEYNHLIPDGHELIATLLIEITNKDSLYDWLPKLVGIQRAFIIQLKNGENIPGIPLDEDRLTREDTTSTVHYLRFPFSDRQIAEFSQGNSVVVVRHPHYQEEVLLSEENTGALTADFVAA